MDFQTQYRLHGYKYNTPEKPVASTTYRDLYRESAPLLFKAPRVKGHDCRPDVLQEFTDNKKWESMMFSHGLEKVFDRVEALHKKEKEEDEKNNKPDKLLYNVGIQGTLEGDFNYPRGLAIDGEGDIIVADTSNNRIQRFNQCAVFKEKFGSKGSGEGEFNDPTGVGVLTNGDLVLADRKNKRIQVLQSSGKFQYSFSTCQEPYSVAVDSGDVIIVGTVKRSVEIYSTTGKLLNGWKTGSVKEKVSILWIAVNDQKQLIISDPADNTVKCYTYKGQLHHSFEPTGVDGMAVTPTGIAVNDVGQIVLADGLNHTVNLYDETGNLLKVIAGPVDDAGSIQTVAISPQGHLVVTEYTNNGPHCLKIFRYRDCECHRMRPSSSKRRTPTTPH